jgi:NAD(P)-dependent dehydrogenase (short-subunit alcohol dehydrogenase family)
MSTVLITGCDYGIGFEFARQYAADGWTVHATCLKAESREKLAALGSDAHFHQLDISDQSAVSTFADELKGEAIDLFLNNAANFSPDGPGPLMLTDMDEFTRIMRVNLVTPDYDAKALADQVAASERKLMIFIGTRSDSGGHCAYRCSKAALNVAVKCISIEFAEQGILATVPNKRSSATETRTSGTGFPIDESISGMRGVIDAVTPKISRDLQRYDSGTIEC